MSWTTPEALKKQLQKLWEKGVLLRELAENSGYFPRQLAFKKPTSDDLSSRFNEVRQWISILKQIENKGYRLEWQEIRHRVIGVNRLPAKIWIDSASDAIKILGLYKTSEIWKCLFQQITAAQPALRNWLIKYPIRALEQDWMRLLAIIAWLQQNPRPNIYLRQIDIPDINSKFIEQHRGILSELLDLTLPSEAIDPQSRGVLQFNRRFGFRDKPQRVRYRLTDRDREIESREFASLNLAISTVFVIENEISFLAFPVSEGCMVIFGRGYGFDMLASALWLRHKKIYYWGDIDTHGFAILSQFRQLFPHTQSFLMDENTLLAHRSSWVEENKPCLRSLSGLTDQEQELYLTLMHNRFGEKIRLEQEYISASWVYQALKAI
ncbi:Wadjet anti-phage system protein JetD domain-containing protein [Enterobacter hormaechei]|uniref:Wadjet anti-phage system protein JetD domain-containing protein n=1 Tax=Enterobacter hormaechei TaxID=158836 RepID=UPI001141AAA6|nr:Wadjet anti-phage system protein JetD domain-containing protein [Enterobacter hormaechei]ELC6415229.1 hypothetical protein [Enterobacter hormaechei]TQD12180.1 hypothetical protein FKC82_19930 [Enterobacter hormaechei]HAV1760965.1 hypothetical protein [Enterobacter hormaechei subsp. steigerwaltii]HCR0470335.1 hypothetical protein [Enterobacter hormaechei]